MLKKEKLKDIQNTLETLSILHQELLILKYELGLSYKEISALMNKNENTLKRMSDVLGKNLLNDLRRMLMMNKEENEFLFDDRHTKKIMRKARFWSTVKMIGITLVVTPIVLIALWYGLRALSLNSAQKVMDDIHLFNEISAPNVQISNQVYDDHLLGGK